METRDPLVFAARRRMTPFTWDDVSTDEYLPPDSQDVYQFALRHGLASTASAYRSTDRPVIRALSACSRAKNSRSPRATAACSKSCHARSTTAAAPRLGLACRRAEPPKLTPREIECMKWVAVGKSNWEIGQVLGISEATAHFHVENAKKKLGKIDAHGSRGVARSARTDLKSCMFSGPI